MIGLDTNILLRWLITDEIAEDAPDQADLVAATIMASDEAFFVNHVVLAETVWVLRHRVNQPKEAIDEILTRLMSSSDVEVDRPDIVAAAKASFRDGSGDFADYLIAHINQSAGCSTTLTFDHKASRSQPLFTRLSR